MSLKDLLNDLGLLIISVFEKWHIKLFMCSVHKEKAAFISSLSGTFLPSAGQSELLQFSNNASSFERLPGQVFTSFVLVFSLHLEVQVSGFSFSVLLCRLFQVKSLEEKGKHRSSRQNK